MDTHRVAGQSSKNTELDMSCLFVRVAFVMKTLARLDIVSVKMLHQDKVQTLEHLVMLPV